MGIYTELHARLLENAIDVSAGELKPLCEAAEAGNITVSIGINEREGDFSRATIFNANALISHEGELLNLHRKLMPTNPERMIHGIGDASGLRVVDTPVGRVGSLICWESYMPLARFSLYAQGVDVYLAPTWDSSGTWHSTMQHIAREGGCYVVGVASCLYGRDIPGDFPHRDDIFPDDDECINPGNAAVYAPGGACIAPPEAGEERLFYVEIDPSAPAVARRSLDAAGHYSRSDVFQLEVNRETFPPVRFQDEWAGWRLAKEHWGKGYATEAAREALRYAFSELGLGEVVSFTTLANTRSQSVMKKIGITHTGRHFIHPHIDRAHPHCEHVLYRITRPE